MTVTAKQALEIIEPIPAEDFCTGDFKNFKGQSCALGHIHRAKGDESGYGDNDGYGLRQLTQKYISEVHNEYADIASVNNNPYVNGYKEPVIKDRVIHLLKDMILAGY